MPPSKQNSDVRPAPGNGLRGANDDHTETSSLGESNHGNSGNGTFHGRMAMFSWEISLPAIRPSLSSLDMRPKNFAEKLSICSFHSKATPRAKARQRPKPSVG